MSNLKLGTRGSALALWQANWTKRALEGRWQGLTIELIPIKTTGDKILDVPLAKIGGKGQRRTVIKAIQFLEEDPTGTMQAIGEDHGDGPGSYAVLTLKALAK